MIREIDVERGGDMNREGQFFEGRDVLELVVVVILLLTKSVSM